MSFYDKYVIEKNLKTGVLTVTEKKSGHQAYFRTNPLRVEGINMASCEYLEVLEYLRSNYNG